MMEFRYSQSEFNDLLSLFQSAIECGEYTEKIRYDTWRKLKKLTGPIIIEYESPFVGIKSRTTFADGIETWDIIYSAKVYSSGFGRFFYDYVVKEKKQMLSNSAISAVSTSYAVNATKVSDLETKADYINDIAYTSCNSNLYYNSDLDTAKAVGNYGYDSTTHVVKIAGEPRSSNAIELNIPDLNHLGYHQIDGTWDSVASHNEVNERFNKLEAELQKKVDKAEIEALKNRKEKENDTIMKGINFDFGPCGNTVRMSMYGMAIQNISGEWVSYNPATQEIVNVDVFNIPDGGKYMYKMPVAIADIKEGDIVIHNRVPMFVTAINKNGTFEVTDVRAGETKNIIPTRNMFGFNFMTKVVSMFGAFTDSPSADQPFGNMLPFLMMGDENGKDIDPMMMFMMMNQSGNNGAMNAMMLHFMTKDKKDIDPAMMWMVMSMVSGAAPAFMTGNYPRGTAIPDVQK